MWELFIQYKWYVLGVIGAVCLYDALFIVREQQIAMLELFGKYSRRCTPGLCIKIPFFERVSGRVNLKVQQLDVNVETKTKDDVFTHFTVSVQFFVIRSRVYHAFYDLQDTERQIRSFVFDVVRAKVPKIMLNDVFEKKDEIAIAVRDELTHTMSRFGYGIVQALVTDIDPDKKVKIAMNEITAAQRLRLAATEKGEADRIIKVKSAQAEAESKALQGQGIADQRKAIVDGLRESVDDFQKALPGSSAADVMNLVLITQYFDTLKDIGASNRSNTILVPHSPSNITDLQEQMRTAMMTAGEVNKSAA